jgi:hypothetical protein
MNTVDLNTIGTQYLEDCENAGMTNNEIVEYLSSLDPETLWLLRTSEFRSNERLKTKTSVKKAVSLIEFMSFKYDHYLGNRWVAKQDELEYALGLEYPDGHDVEGSIIVYSSKWHPRHAKTIPLPNFLADPAGSLKQKLEL